MEQKHIEEQLHTHEEKLNAIYKSVEQTRKLFLTTLIISIVMFILPLLGLIFVIPWVLSTIGAAYSGLL